MHGDRLAHSPACARHAVTADCPVECLAPLLGSRVVGRLARADGRHGKQVASCGVPATVGDVVRLYRQGRLGEIAGLGRLGIREIGLALVSHGLVAAEDGDAITPDCPVECLRSVISGRVLNRLARADGRGVPVAPGGPPMLPAGNCQECPASAVLHAAGKHWPVMPRNCCETFSRFAGIRH